ncbi:replication initiation protein [Nocardia suismassiliense]|uniref:replication protein RepA n=1 Tax=Nocardia suismassiliense TaxID=2077092 RepID=UPI00131F26FF|nr:replication protein RepA [Nocardia suismassiliense]
MPDEQTPPAPPGTAGAACAPRLLTHPVPLIPEEASPVSDTRRTGTTLVRITPSAAGHPYGGIARLILIWMCTETLHPERSPDDELHLGSVLEFARTLGLQPTGKDDPAVAAVFDQLCRLLTSHFYVIREDFVISDYLASSISVDDVPTKRSRWFPAQQPEGRISIRLSLDFFLDFGIYPVAVTWEDVVHLHHSPGELDQYCRAAPPVKTITERDSTSLIPWADIEQRWGALTGDPVSGKLQQRLQKRADQYFEEVRGAPERGRSGPAELT